MGKEGKVTAWKVTKADGIGKEEIQTSPKTVAPEKPSLGKGSLE